MSKRGVNVDTHEATARTVVLQEEEMNVGEHGLQKAVTPKPRFCVGRSNPEKLETQSIFLYVNECQYQTAKLWEKAIVLCAVCSACRYAFFCNVLPFCIWEKIFLRMVKIFHNN